jgi:Protein of unknown function (DUF3551)
MHMLKPISIAVSVLSLCAMPASAEGAPWCANRSDGSTNCGYYSWEQCRANSSVNTNCTSNQWYTGNGGNSRRRQRD